MIRVSSATTNTSWHNLSFAKSKQIIWTINLVSFHEQCIHMKFYNLFCFAKIMKSMDWKDQVICNTQVLVCLSFDVFIFHKTNYKVYRIFSGFFPGLTNIMMWIFKLWNINANERLWQLVTVRTISSCGIGFRNPSHARLLMDRLFSNWSLVEFDLQSDKVLNCHLIGFRYIFRWGSLFMCQYNVL